MFLKKRIYLDYAAGVSGNPSSPHEEGRCAKKMLEDARTSIARLVEVQSDDVLFTSGATESNALAILGLVHALRALATRDAPRRNNMHVLYLPSSHVSIVENVKMLIEEGNIVEALPIKDYRVDTEALAKMIRSETVLISMDAVCGETGVVWNTREVADVLRKWHARGNQPTKGNAQAAARSIQHPFAGHLPRAVLHVDASQAPWTEKITRDHFGADLLTFDGAKIGAARGSGVLIAHRTIPIVPFYKGGGQERGVRPGTEAPRLALSFATALGVAVIERESFRVSATQNREQLIKLIKSAIVNVFINEGRMQVPNILNLSLLGRDTDYVVALLDEAGCAVSTRSACETDSEEGSRAVFALTGDKRRASSTLRISWGPSISAHELTHFAKALVRAVGFIDSSNQG